ncbi:Solute carrier family 35 member G1 [Pseudolycoriella hygida]|uniref:Solute carrier family 35 member G1 n=1 Tax=Pseudolycoriella hygida TaxID=35572 RepID=A0A9Q0RXU3_9DIPT|nr:Solute carrier family 35 member G1 [Pseudolycoriella hygida]
MPEHLELQQLVLNDTTSQNYRRILRGWTCPYIGLIFATISSLFFSLCSVIVKHCVTINPVQLASFRFIGVMLPAIPIALYTEEPFYPQGQRIILTLRCFIGSTGLLLSFYAFRHMPLADASVIIFSTPVFVAIFARLFLKEPCGLFNVITVILTLIGVVLITRPTFLFSDSVHSLVDEDVIDPSYKVNVWGPVSALSATLFGANAYVLLRALKNVHFAVIMSNFGAFGLIYSLVIAIWLGNLCWPMCGTERLLVVALAAFSFFGQILLTLALKLEQAGPVSIGRSCDIVFAFIWQVIFFKERLNGYSVIGAILVTSSVIWTGVRKWLISLPRDSTIRKRMKYVIME